MLEKMWRQKDGSYVFGIIQKFYDIERKIVTELLSEFWIML